MIIFLKVICLLQYIYKCLEKQKMFSLQSMKYSVYVCVYVCTLECY